MFFWEAGASVVQNVGILPKVFILGLIGLAMGFGRWRVFLRSLGNRIGWKKEVMIYLSGFAAIPSFFKFSDGLRLVYLKGEGVNMPDAVSVMGMERLTDIVMTSVMLLLVMGRSTGALGVLGLVALGLVGLKTRSFWFEKLNRFEKVKRVEEAVEATLQSLKRLGRPEIMLGALGFTLGMYVFQLMALAAAVGTGPLQVLGGYLVGWLTITLAPTPAGIGFYEATVSATLAGVAGAAAGLGAVLVFRFVVLWLPVVLGQISVALMRG